METAELFERLSVALAIGVLIGVERGWTLRDDPEGGRTAGLRTFALSGLLGGVIAALAMRLEAGAVLLGLAFAVFGLALAMFRYREMVHDRTYGATTLVAGLLTFALGALAVVADPVVAAAAGVAVAALLALKSALHAWLREITWPELRSALVLLAMTVILLPILPDRAMGPWQALNPRELWLMTILIAAISATGYVAIKLMGERRGIAASAVAGGLVSSTAVTLTYARLARAHADQTALLSAGAVLSGGTMMGRIAVVAGLVNSALLPWLLPPLAVAGIAMLVGAVVLMRMDASGTQQAELDLKSPFEVSTVLQFGVLLALVMLAAQGLVQWAGGHGAVVLAALSGIADVDALTLSMARLGGDKLSLETAASAILVAAAVNTVSKSVLAALAGGRMPGAHVAVASMAALLCAVAVLPLSGPDGAIGSVIAAAIGR